MIQLVEDYASGNGWSQTRHYAVPTTDIAVHTHPKLLNWFKIPNYWLDKKIPFLKFKNSKPISNNFGNIIENIFIKFPLRIIVTLPITLAITAVFLAITFYSVIGAGSCF